MAKDPFTGRTVYGPDHEMNKAIRDAAKRGTTEVPVEKVLLSKEDQIKEAAERVRNRGLTSGVKRDGQG
jgi:hypothetical protein